MKGLVKLGMLIAVATGAAALAQSPLAGTWKATQNGLPLVELTVRNDGARTTGTALFYLIMDNRDGRGAHVGGQAHGAMENLKTGKDSLTFDIHRKDGSLVSFRVELRPDGHAKLFRTGDSKEAQNDGRPGPPTEGLDLVHEQ